MLFCSREEKMGVTKKTFGVLYPHSPITYAFAFFSISNSVAHSSSYEGLHQGTPKTLDERRESLLHFYAIGDWGADLSSPHAVSRQREVANGIASLLEGATQNENPPFVLSLGDNFYPSGVSGSKDDVALRFSQSFELIYSHDAFKNISWYVVPGNRDYEGDIAAQMRYGLSGSSRWIFPDCFHRTVREIRVPVGDFVKDTVKVEILAIDTMQLTDFLEASMEAVRENRLLSASFGSSDEEMAERGLKWIEHHLSNSDADYLLVTGHYPVYAAGYKGRVPGLEKLLHRYKVSAYVSGHDHCQEHLTKDDVNYLISGTGMECCCEGNNINQLPPGTKVQYLLNDENNPTGAKGGFLSFDVRLEHMVVRFHDEAGNELYRTKIFPRLRKLSFKQE